MNDERATHRPLDLLQKNRSRSLRTLRDLRIADLELFITAAELEHLGKAATLHYMSQSAASSAIMRIEQAFGIALCEHQKRGFQLTRQGKELLPQLISWVKTLTESIALQKPLPLRLATTHAIAQVAVPAVWSIERIDLALMRPDQAYGAVLCNEADIALVLDNAPWEGVTASEIGQGEFRLYCSQSECPISPLLLPENQIEVLTLQQRWQEMHKTPIAIKARLPSWSLIASLCKHSAEVGFLPDFLGQQSELYPVSWQPKPTPYRVLALYRNTTPHFLERLEPLLTSWSALF